MKYYKGKSTMVEQTGTKNNETVITEPKSRMLINTVVKDCPRISVYVKITNILEEETIPITFEIVKGRLFSNCSCKGRITEFKKPSKLFHKGTPTSEDN